MILFYNGNIIRQYLKVKDELPDDPEFELPEWFILEFAGSLAATILWVINYNLCNYTAK